MFKNKRITISTWYIISIIIMAVLYFLGSNIMITSRDFRDRIIQHFSILKQSISADYNWGIFVLAAFIVFSLIVLVRNKK